MESTSFTDLLNYQRKPIVIDQTSADTIPAAFIPEGYKSESLEFLLPQPKCKRANVGIDDAQSYIAYINRHKTPSTVSYARVSIQRQSLNVIGVIDNHAAEPTVDLPAPEGFNGAGWGSHRATFNPEKTPEWIKWNEFNRTTMSQVEFAAFIEDNLPDIQSVDGSPTGGDMLAMALNFEATYDKKFVSKVNNQSGGITMEFKSTDDKETVSKMEVFSRFTTGLMVFMNSAAYPLEARLKYKANSGQLQFWYELIRPERVFLTACTNIVNKIAEETAVLVINGVPDIK